MLEQIPDSSQAVGFFPITCIALIESFEAGAIIRCNFE